MKTDILQSIQTISLDDIGKPVEEPDVQEEERTSEQNEVEGQIGPCDCYGMKLSYAYRRAFSDMELLGSLDSFDFSEGRCYCFMSRGDVDLASYLRMMLHAQNIPELIVSSWRADVSDFEMLRKWKLEGRIGRMDIYLGRLYAYGSERRYNITTFREMMADFPDVTVKVFRNHSKLICGRGEKFNFILQSSANLNTNVNAENACLIIDSGCWDFYRAFFSDIKSLI